VERERYYQQLSGKTGYALETLKAQGAGSRPLEQPIAAAEHKADASRRQAQRALPKEDERTRAENALLFHMVQSRAAAKIACDTGVGALFSSEGLCAFARALTEAYAAGTEPNIPLLLAGMKKEDAERVSAALRDEAACAESEKKRRRIVFAESNNATCRSRLKKSNANWPRPALTPERQAELLRNMQGLNLRMRGMR
jgi:hypothetical protein